MQTQMHTKGENGRATQRIRVKETKRYATEKKEDICDISKAYLIPNAANMQNAKWAE